ncbi:hypothetical protein AUJ10_03320 [Candidatus Pacearchaeota archaeon CG1_02_31_27]|nr:MAG: hypothetical protein AUJ10_03320 [Candidatus Pacearchaeota archaeon CG1_02_31_27]PIN92437.1 MAG: hypothetical protein COU55_01380 [Candidatus Pacearchaeota archaeon CG10_big_fil_rev_8_21_14_0_10_31_59]PIZ81022.1 MAG: hypothetical protein COX99_01080 [Candidatus Pacearchaeota archaeon CG_4_10_14_0_2_um_filter_31_10]
MANKGILWISLAMLVLLILVAGLLIGYFSVKPAEKVEKQEITITSQKVIDEVSLKTEEVKKEQTYTRTIPVCEFNWDKCCYETKCKEVPCECEVYMYGCPAGTRYIGDEDEKVFYRIDDPRAQYINWKDRVCFDSMSEAREDDYEFEHFHMPLYGYGFVFGFGNCC